MSFLARSTRAFILAVVAVAPITLAAQDPSRWASEGWAIRNMANRPPERTPGQQVVAFTSPGGDVPAMPPTTLLCFGGILDAGGSTLQPGTLYGPSCVFFLAGEQRDLPRSSTAFLVIDAAVESMLSWQKPVTSQVPEGKGQIMKTQITNPGLMQPGVGRERANLTGSSVYYYGVCRLPHPTIPNAYAYGKIGKDPSCMYALNDHGINESNTSKFEVLVYQARR